MTDRQRAMEAAQKAIDAFRLRQSAHWGTDPLPIPAHIPFAELALAEHRRAEDLARRVEELNLEVANEKMRNKVRSEALERVHAVADERAAVIAVTEAAPKVWKQVAEAAERRVAELTEVLQRSA